MDPPHPAVAGEQAVGQLAGGGAEEAGGVPRVPPQAQAAARRAEGKAGDQLQHPPGTSCIWPWFSSDFIHFKVKHFFSNGRN